MAESCTGGLITDRLTDIPGSSAFLERGVVTYSNASKTALLGVPETVIAAHGAVSAETARLMAEGVRRLAGTDLGLAVTGIAGPSGGTEAKPVGTVYHRPRRRREDPLPPLCLPLGPAAEQDHGLPDRPPDALAPSFGGCRR